MPASAPRPTTWGRSPLVAAGIALACMLGALVLTVGGALAQEFGAVALGALLLLVALAAVVVLVVLLVRDRFPRQVLERLDGMERRLERIDGVRPPSPAEPMAAAATPVEEVPGPPPVPVPATPEAPPAPTAAPSVPAEPPAVEPAAMPAPPSPPAAPAPSTHTGGGSWELALGGRWLGRLGIVVLLVGIGLFLKFGWDQGWFRPSPTVRVLLGLGVGVGLLLGGEAARRRERYRLLAQVLSAGGVGAVYLSTWAAHGLYHLVTAPTAFLLVAAAAAFGVAVAVATRARAVALLAAAGGFLVPALVPLEPLQLGLLYPLLALLDLAVLVVAVARRWPELGALAFIGTALNMIAPLGLAADSTGLLRDGAVLLLLLALFVGVSVGHAWHRRLQPGWIEVAVLATASLSGWGAGLWRLDALGEAVGGAWTLTVLLLEVAAAALLLRRLGRAGGARQALLGVALVLGVALPPVVWNGAAVAAGWAVEALLMVAAGTRAPALVLAAAGVLVELLAVGATVAAANPPAGPPFVTGGAVLRLLAAGALGAALLLLERWHDAGVWREPLLLVAAPSGAVAALVWLIPEAEAMTSRALAAQPAGAALGVVVTAALAVLAASLLAAWPWRPAATTSVTGGLLLALALLIDPTGGWGRGWGGAAAAAPVLWGALAVLVLAWRGAREDRGWCRGVAAAGAVLAAVAGVLLRAPAAWPGDAVTAAGVIPAALLSGAAVTLLVGAALVRDWPGAGLLPALSVSGWVLAVAAGSRLLATAMALAGPQATPDSRRIAVVSLSVLWGAAGLAFVFGGLARAAGHLRYLGLGLLVVTAAKVFLWDLASAATVIRIVAFLVTGGALVGGSYLYARFRERLEAQS